MREDLTGADLFASIQLQRQLDPRLVIVVEGPEDCGLIDAHINDGIAQTIPGYGKQSVIDAAALFQHEGVAEVRLLVDADFDRHRGLTGHLGDNVVLSEYHDLIADIFFRCPQVLTSLLSNFSDREERAEHLAKTNLQPRQHIVNIAVSIGATRYYSVIYKLELKMRDFPVAPIVEQYNGGADLLDAVILLATRRTKLQSIPPELGHLQAHVDSINEDVKYLCSSHDIIAAIAAMQRRSWGGSAGSDAISAAFRAAVPCTCFQDTEPIRQLSAWAGNLEHAIWTCPTV